MPDFGLTVLAGMYSFVESLNWWTRDSLQSTDWVQNVAQSTERDVRSETCDPVQHIE
jgi:hypothetical protein